MADNLSTLVGSFVPTTNIWDVSEIYDVDVNSPEFKELLVRLYQNLNNISLSINTRDAAYYNTSEFVSGQLFFPDPTLNSQSNSAPDFRQAMRLVIDFGSLPNTAAKTVPHGLIMSSTTTITRLYAAASNPTGLVYIPIPYASPTLANNIELSVDVTNVTITTGSDRTAFTRCIVVLEYLQS